MTRPCQVEPTFQFIFKLITGQKHQRQNPFGPIAIAEYALFSFVNPHYFDGSEAVPDCVMWFARALVTDHQCSGSKNLSPSRKP